MPDREKIVKLIEEEINVCEAVNQCYRTIDLPALRDILALLKEQEEKQVNISQTYRGMKYGLCPRCEKQIDTLVNPHYCGNCGQELNWK